MKIIFKQRKTDVVLTTAWRPKLGDVLLGAWEWLLEDGKDIREKKEAMNQGSCESVFRQKLVLVKWQILLAKGKKGI